MRKPRHVASPIEHVAAILAGAGERLAASPPDVPGAAQALSGLSAHAETLAMPRYEGHVRPLKALSECLSRGDVTGARRHLGRASRVLRPSSNDKPFAVGDNVSVTRSRHGWHDGELEGKVRSRSASPTGSWSYVVTDGTGEEHEVERTRDMHPTR